MNNFPVRASLGSLLALAIVPTPLQADVLRVAGDGSAPYFTVQDAVDAAGDRDVILVKPGQYPGFTIDDKHLAVVADDGGAVEIQDTVTIRNLAQARVAQLDGLTVRGLNAPGAPGHGLVATSNAGSVRAQNCSFTGDPFEPVPFNLPSQGALVTICADVIFNQCSFSGGPGWGSSSSLIHQAGHGVSIDLAWVGAFDSQFQGSDGRDEPSGGQAGGFGAKLDGGGSILFIAGCTVRGGDGGTALNVDAGPGGSGGAAIWGQVNTFVYFNDSDLIGGEGGSSNGTQQTGNDGGPYTHNGSIEEYAGPRRAMVGPTKVQGGDDLGVRFEGAPGDRVFLALSPRTEFGLNFSIESLWAMNALSKTTSEPVAVIPASGEINVTVPTWILGAAQDAGLMYVQGLVLDTQGNTRLTNPLFLHRFQCEFSADCNSNGTPDYCDIDAGTSLDCDQDGVPDECGFGAGSSDCNANGVPDLCDLSSGTSLDCDGDSYPDECQADCNNNGIADTCDLSAGTSSDCDGDLVPDECSIDCNSNGVPDLCDISSGTSSDSNGNDVPDECQVPGMTYYVDAAAPVGGSGTITEPFQSIGYAVDYALSGDTILVAKGTYSGPENGDMSFGSRELTVRSLGGASDCIIDLGGARRAFLLPGSQTNASRIEGFTFRNGYAVSEGIALQGGSAIAVLNASPVIEACIFEDCTSGGFLSQGSGTLLVYGNQVPGAGTRVLGCEFSGCVAERGAGIHAWDLHNDRLTVEGCDFTGGEAVSGGGIYTYNSELFVRGCEFTGNTAISNGNGGGISANWNNKNLTVVDSVFRDNESSVGAGIYCWDAGVYTVLRCTFAENFGRFAVGTYALSNNENRISHSIFANNVAGYLFSVNTGGGMAIFNGGDNVSSSVDNCLFFGNEARDNFSTARGGGLHVQGGTGVSVTNCSFFLNRAGEGGGLHLSEGLLNGVGSAIVRNSLFWENTADGVLEQLRVDEDAVLDFDYNNLQDGASGITVESGSTLLYGANNSSFYPGFIDPDGPDDDITTWEDNDVRLGPTSAARDAGDNFAVPQDVYDLDGDGDPFEAVPIDLLGVPRFVDSSQPDTGNGAAPIVDLGCYEDQ